MSGYNFRLYYDRDFKNELVSIGSSTTFSTVGVGTVGIANTVTASTVTLNFNKDLPSKVYYQLDKAGYISTADTEVTNYSEINFVDSIYSGTYSVTGVGETVFTVSLKSVQKILTIINHLQAFLSIPLLHQELLVVLINYKLLSVEQVTRNCLSL